MATVAGTTSATTTVCEVIQEARDSSIRLLALLQATSADPGRQKLAEQIIRRIDCVLAAVRGAGDGNKRRSAHGPAAHRPPAGSRTRITCRGELGARFVSSMTDDGFKWRKYGEKIISHHRYRRFYFRCTYRDEHGCGAKKQVQQTHEDPSLFETTYFGKHTPACPRDAASVAMVDSTFVPQVPFHTTSGPGVASDNEPQEQRAPPEETDLVPANVAEFTEYCPPVNGQLMKLIPANVSFASLAEGMESSGNGLEEFISLLWS